MLESQVMLECERLCPRAPRANYLCRPDRCRNSHNSPQTLVFMGQLVFDKHKNPFQLYECGLCGKRLVVEMDCHTIDIDDPRWVRAAIPNESFLNRMNISADAQREATILYSPNGRPVVVE
jgi:hypothetical protein